MAAVVYVSTGECKSSVGLCDSTHPGVSEYSSTVRIS